MTETRTSNHASPFGRIIVGAYGTLVFGNGVTAIEGEITEAGDDYILVQTPAPNADTLAVPLASIVYFRYDGES